MRVLRRYLWQFGFDLQSPSRLEERHQLVATSEERIAETHFGFPRVGAHVRGFSGLKYFGCQKLVQSHSCVRDHLLGLMRSQRKGGTSLDWPGAPWPGWPLEQLMLASIEQPKAIQREGL